MAHLSIAPPRVETVRRAFTVQEVADQLGVSHWTVRNAIQRGEIRTFRVGAKLLINREELERLVNAGS